MERSENITKVLRDRFGEKDNSSATIEFAYDLQAGSYTKEFFEKYGYFVEFTEEISRQIIKHSKKADTFLDVGAGELTVTSLIHEHLIRKPTQTYACDISWSRLQAGVNLLKSEYSALVPTTNIFVCDATSLPLPSKSIDVAYTVHAIEPNGRTMDQIISEIFRVCRSVAFFVEPNFERQNKSGQEHMKKMRYIKGLEVAIQRQGGKIIDIVEMSTYANSNNRPYIHIVQPPGALKTKLNSIGTGSGIHNGGRYSVPGTEQIGCPLIIKSRISKLLLPEDF